ncbi:MAG: YdeI/OmpD-associated family protein [Bacteroidota bacterium]|nr:YdeI/OmpD-associated family protein [Bacteroidota bacterium]
MKSFAAKILKIGINPYVLLPAPVLNYLFEKAKKSKGPIPVRGTLNGKKFTQTLVKYSGKWRLYLNTPMREAAGIDVGDMARLKIEHDPSPRTLSIHPKLKKMLAENKNAKASFDKLAPYRRKEIIRYISYLKTEDSVDSNIEKVIKHLSGKGRFAGRD